MSEDEPLPDLPQKIYVRVEAGNDPEETWLNANETMSDHAEMGETRHVGTYVLTEVHEVTGTVTATPLKQESDNASA